MTNENKQKNTDKYECNICAFKCCKKSNYVTHLSTSKHKIRTNTNEKVAKKLQKSCESCKKLRKVAKKLRKVAKKIFKLLWKFIILNS